MRLALLSALALLPALGCIRHRSDAPVHPSTCRVERVTAAIADTGHFQFHGPSRDGRRLIVGWFRGSDQGAYLLDLRTGARTSLPGLNNAGAFSPDGSRFVVANREPAGNRELIEVGSRGGERRVIAPDAAADFLATYSADGRLLLFNSYRTGRSDLYLLDRRTGALRRLTTFEGYDAHGDLSPDSREVIFHRQVGERDYDILRLDRGTGAERLLVGGAGEQAYPAWSPDGEHIAFASDSADTPGRLDLYVTDRERRRTVRLTQEPGYNAYPAWSADGRWLYFNGEREGRRDVYRIAMTSPLRCAVAP